MYFQDFYSHSNWVELGNSEPYINLIRPDLPLDNLAGLWKSICVLVIPIGGLRVFLCVEYGSHKDGNSHKIVKLNLGAYQLTK